jgi:group I intron endonuclease
MFVYKIVNRVNEKIYIGKTNKRSINIRWHQHVWEAKRGAKWALHRAIRKYGVSQFSIEPLCKVSTEAELNEKEIGFIKLYDSMNPDKGYNLTPGGDGVAYWTGKKRSPETNAKRVATWRANGNSVSPNLWTPEALAKRTATRRSNGNYQENVGRKNTPETIEKMKLAALNRDLTPYVGLKRSPEAIENLRQGALTRVANESLEDKQKRAAACSSTLSLKYGAKRDEAKKLRESGLSYSAIAAELGVSYKAARLWSLGQSTYKPKAPI